MMDAKNLMEKHRVEAAFGMVIAEDEGTSLEGEAEGRVQNVVVIVCYIRRVGFVSMLRNCRTPAVINVCPSSFVQPRGLLYHTTHIIFHKLRPPT